MHLFICIMLLAACCSNTYVDAASVLGNRVAGSTLRSVNSGSRETESVTIALNLPRGFKPQPAPAKPLLYPFVTAIPTAASTAGWRPMLGSNLPIQNQNFIPLLQDRSTIEDETPHMEEGPILESVVYGTWKPDPPLKPDKIFRQKQSGTTNHPLDRASQEPAVQNLGHSYPIADRSDSVHYVHQLIAPKYDHQANSPNEHTLPIVSVNISDPNLREIAKQINDSAETVNFYNHKANSASSNTTWPTATTHTSEESMKMWPTDFMSSTEEITTTKIPKSSYNYVGDNAVPPLALENLPENLLPQVPLNITKVGVPYEQQNSADGPTICVPLTVREQINADEYVDIERVYCFPLPPVEIAATNLNATEAVMHNYDSKGTTNASNTNLGNSFIILIVSIIFMIKFKWF